MVIVKIHYGLGNQLFQYAFSRAVAMEYNYEVRLDISFYNTANPDAKHPRLYLLPHFNILENYVSEDVAGTFTKPGFLQRRMRNLESIVKPYYRRKLVREQRLDYDSNIKKIRDNCYLFGYWQDLRYFQKYEEQIRNELTFKSNPNLVNREWLDQIVRSNAVCIHIRRGDYLTDVNTYSSAGVCNLDYYYNAINIINEHVANPVYYIFSDDSDWVESNLKLEGTCFYIKHNSESDAVEDLRLMQACKHHILSNSTFSWWSAWLSNSGGIVITPAIWRKEGPQMFLPSQWIKL